MPPHRLTTDATKLNPHAKQHFQPLENVLYPFSNDWKNTPKSFQRLEKPPQKAPMIGKNA
jgi:hypothetical protein